MFVYSCMSTRRWHDVFEVDTGASDGFGLVLRLIMHIHSWYAFESFKWRVSSPRQLTYILLLYVYVCILQMFGSDYPIHEPVHL